MQTLESLLAGLRAAGEHTRLRILALCSRGELSVSELTKILGQSQPRVSRHLKVLVEAGLLERMPEGAQVFFRVSDQAETSALAHALVKLIPNEDIGLTRDFSRLQQVRDARAKRAQDYFQTVAPTWDRIRSLYVPQPQVEAKLLELLGDAPIGDLLDIGTGTGRILAILAARVERGIGIDLSSPMLAVARTNIERGGYDNIHVRQGDMYHLPIDDGSIDLAILHMVLHYSDSPGEVIREAARVLRPNGRLMIVDFAVHGEEKLRAECRHHRLGFTDSEIRQGFESAGLESASKVEQLVGDPLTVRFWQAQRKQKLHLLKSSHRI